jgi:hypothetical protein
MFLDNQFSPQMCSLSINLVNKTTIIWDIEDLFAIYIYSMTNMTVSYTFGDQNGGLLFCLVKTHEMIQIVNWFSGDWYWIWYRGPWFDLHSCDWERSETIWYQNWPEPYSTGGKKKTHEMMGLYMLTRMLIIIGRHH